MKDLEQEQKAMVVHEGHESGRFSFLLYLSLNLDRSVLQLFVCLSCE